MGRVTKEQQYRRALKALSEVDASDIAVRMQDAGEHFPKRCLRFDLENMLGDLDRDTEPGDVMKVLHAMLEESVRAYCDGEEFPDVYVAPLYVNVDDLGVSIQYRPIDNYTTDGDLFDYDEESE